MNDFLLYFLGAAVCLLLAHYIGDYFVQTHHQAKHKGLTDDRLREGQLNCLKHATSYTLTQIVVMCGVFFASSYGGPYFFVVAALVVNGVAHYMIDRRWTLELFARAVLHKGEWIDNDPHALPALDQAAHFALFLPVAATIAVVSI